MRVGGGILAIAPRARRGRGVARVAAGLVRALCVVAPLLFAAPGARAQEHEHHGTAGLPPNGGEQLGRVSFETSCSAAAAPRFDRAMALLHSFEFGAAISGFEEVARLDPTCAMAHWGVALASWGNPFAAGQKPARQIQGGQAAIQEATRVGPRTEREAAYVAAAAELYRDPEHRDQRTRVLAYRDAMAALAARYPADMEASIFYALALAQSVPPTDKTYADLLKAGAILEPLFAAHPDHPGLAHYIIHSYDVPPLAAKALAAARAYARIAPSAPHALHMPSHTFTRLGYWQDSIETNIASAAAAKRDGSTGEELHATDYQMYAYLQTGQDAAARRLLDALPGIAARFDPDVVAGAAPGVAGVYALAAVPARWVLERGAWAEAAALELHPSKFLQTEAVTQFARGMGAARRCDQEGAAAAAAALGALEQRLAAAHEDYWAGQTGIQRRDVAAWLLQCQGKGAEALAEMRTAADLEDATEKTAMTPGPIAPARELLGEMLLQQKQPAQALEAFSATLRKEPNRYRALAGAAQAAAQAGDPKTAAAMEARLVETCARGDRPGRPELAAARRKAPKKKV